jgi:hypothetical protein
MTAKEEDILSSTNLIKKGVVLDKLFESIIVDKVNPNDIIIGDKNAIILATRVLGYGPDYEFQFYSSKKNDYVSVKMDLTQVKTKEIDLSLFNNKNEFEYTTKYGKNKIVFKILTHGDEHEIDREVDALKKIKYVNKTFFITNHVLSHLNNNSVEKICSEINSKKVPVGSILSFGELWTKDKNICGFTNTARSIKWWKENLNSWNLNFHGPKLNSESKDIFKGFHGHKVM